MQSKRKQMTNVDRSRSRSLSPGKSKAKLVNKQSKQLVPRSGRPLNKNQRSPLNPSLSRSHSKASLNKSKKQLNRSLSQPRVGNGGKRNNGGKAGRSQEREIDRSRSKSRNKQGKQQGQGRPQGQGKSQIKSQMRPHANTQGKSQVKTQVDPHTVKAGEREMGLVFVRPEFDRVVLRGLEITDEVFDKYLEMINNDNDTNYVMNALPELRSCKKEDETEGRDFVSGRISRLSGIFDNLSVDKILTPVKKVPHYYSGACGKNLSLVRVVLQTRFKVEVDLGFLQYSLDGDKLTVFRIYVSKIYRRMNYVGFVYLECLKGLMGRHPGAERWSMFILEKNVNVHKFFKFLGFHIDKIATESKNKSVDYFQEFAIKKKELNTVLASMTK